LHGGSRASRCSNTGNNVNTPLLLAKNCALTSFRSHTRAPPSNLADREKGLCGWCRPA
jgi:hypothetical protein